MTKNRRPPTASISDIEISEYLRVLSQCVQNIYIILDVHSAEIPCYDKRLVQFYRIEQRKLPGILNRPIGVDAFSFRLDVLRDNLISNNYGMEEMKENIKLAKNELISLLDNIQIVREKDPEYKATTGLEDGDLRDHIVSLIESGKKIYPKSLLGLKEELLDKKYDESNEDILLKTLGVKIKGDKIIKGTENKHINSTDKALIYYLYDKSIINKDECFSIDDLSKAKEINKSKRYTQNRITAVNNTVKEILSERKNIKIKLIIKEKNRHGYHLNPKLFT